MQAYRYDDLKPNGFDRAVTVYAAPTSAGVATLACLAPAADAESFGATCDQIANTLELSSGDPFPVGPSKDYAGAVEQDARPRSARPTRRARRKLKCGQDAAGARRRRRARWPSAFHAAGKSLAAQDLSPADRGVNGAAGQGAAPDRRGLRQGRLARRPRRTSRRSTRPATTSRRAARPSRARSPG